MRHQRTSPQGLASVAGLVLAIGCGGGDPSTASPDGGEPDGAPACDGAAGSFHDLALVVDGETRSYFLYVPPQYDCAAPWPLLMDFHGTADGAEPEIAYKNDELIALAAADGFIAVRPRSRSSGGVFRWDQNPGDLPRNVAFAHALVAELASRYHLDPERVYASGFSSGSNMASQFLADDPAVFKGLAMVAGGTWSAPAVAGDPPARIYATTGYRDYLWFSVVTLRGVLAGADYPMENLFLRQSDIGHELYGWHFAELWSWLDRGERPPAGQLAAGWARDDGFTWGSSLTELARAGDGAWIAAAGDGAIYRRGPSGAWRQAGALAGQPALVGLCIAPSGRGLAIGQQRAALSDDDGASWQATTAPPGLDPNGLSPAALNGIACDDDQHVASGGYWASDVSDNGGDSWSAGDMTAIYGVSAQVASVARSRRGTWLAVGYYDYIGRSTDGATFTPLATTPESHEWWTDAAPHGSRWTVVGEEGTVLLSVDDGVHFSKVATPTGEDLYAVAFADADHGLAVGAHGTAIRTDDGGETWSDASTGLDVFLGDVGFLDETTALVVGEDGTALTFALP